MEAENKESIESKESKENKENIEKKESQEIKENKEKEYILWNRYEILHRRFKKKMECFDNNMEIFNKLTSSLKDFQKVLNSIITKNYCLFPDEELTQANALNFIKSTLELEMNQISLNVDLFKKLMIDQLKKKREEDSKKEKELYALFTKYLSKYNDSKLVADKAKTKYHQSCKVAEGSLKTAKSMKIKSVGGSAEMQMTIQKLESKAQELSIEAKKNLEKYTLSLKEANKNREDSIRYQKLLIQLYNDLEHHEGEFIADIMTQFYSRIKEENDSKTKYISDSEPILKKLDIKLDQEKILEVFKSTARPDEEIKLAQYEPEIDFEKGSTPDDYKINHDVLVSMKQFISNDICPSFDIEKENKKQEMRELCKKIFITNVPFTDEEKSKLMGYIEQKWSQNYFLIYLSRQRTNGRFQRSEKLVKDLSELLKLILKTAQNNEDYESARNCMILSQTYFFEEKDKENNVHKKYLLEFIVEYEWLRTPGFWRGLISAMINIEIKKYQEMNPNEALVMDENNPKSRARLSNICFSQLLPYCNNMLEFYMDERVVVKIVDEFVEKYHVEADMAEAILGVVNADKEAIQKIREEIKNNPNLENELYSLEEVRSKMNNKSKK